MRLEIIVNFDPCRHKSHLSGNTSLRIDIYVPRDTARRKRGNTIQYYSLSCGKVDLIFIKCAYMYIRFYTNNTLALLAASHRPRNKLFCSSRMLETMNTLTVKVTSLTLLLQLMWFDRCESLTDSSLPPIFFPFGKDEGDRLLYLGDGICGQPINIPYEIFNHSTIFVSSYTWKT